MRAVVQRVKQAYVEIEGKEIARIGMGLCCLVGFETGDTAEDIDRIARKICTLRVFEDEQGLMNLDVGEVKGGILLVSQFTLLGDARRGRRPSFTAAEQPDQAARLFDETVRHVSRLHPGTVVSGRFQTTMDVHLVNHGPVTILLDSRRLF
ncbi:MAG: D-aminoacyl-tRNA deacylase [Desulfomonilia bacterium]